MQRRGRREVHEGNTDFAWKKRNSKQDKCLMSCSIIKPEAEMYIALLMTRG